MDWYLVAATIIIFGIFFVLFIASIQAYFRWQCRRIEREAAWDAMIVRLTVCRDANEEDCERRLREARLREKMNTEIAASNE